MSVVMTPALVTVPDLTVTTAAFLRIPCKARGVKGLHNATNAYIDVPASAEHGTILECSHPLCKGSGRRFRYCTICKIPVAFRNFAKRHSHGLLRPPQSDDIMIAHQSPLGQQCQAVPNLDDTSSDTAPTGTKHEFDANSNSRVPDTGGSVPKEIWVGDASDQSLHDQSFHDQGLVKVCVSPRELQWLSLLRDRPCDHEKDSIEAWISAIMQISSTVESNKVDNNMTRAKRRKKNTSCCAPPNQTRSALCCITEPSLSTLKENLQGPYGSICSGVKGSSVFESSCTGAKDDSCIRGSLLSCTGKGDNCCEHIAEFDIMDVQDTLQK